MKNLYITFFFLFLVGLVGSAQAQDWDTIETFSGEGITNTEAFTIDVSEWRVVYESEATGFAGEEGGAGHIFQLYLQQPNEEFGMDILANQTNKRLINGKSSVYKDGRFYFKVNASNGSWNIKVQVPSNSEPSSTNQQVSPSVGEGKIDATNYESVIQSLEKSNISSKSIQKQFSNALLIIMASKLDLAKMIEIQEVMNEEEGDTNELFVDIIRDDIHGKTVSEVISYSESIELDETEEKLYQIFHPFW